MSNSTTLENAFLNRFQSLWSRKRRFELGRVAATMLLLSLMGLIALSALDYCLELDHASRVTALWTMIGSVSLLSTITLWRTVRSWNRPTTAMEIEAAYPQLGQSVRTTVQFGAMHDEEVRSEGVATSLVSALFNQTHQRALPLSIEDVVPVKGLILISVGFASVLLVLVNVLNADWEWYTSTSRACLSDISYRQLEVQPGDQTVDEGSGLTIDVALIGRVNRQVTLFTRSINDANAEWMEHTLEVKQTDSSTQQFGNSDAQASVKSKSLSRPQALFVARMDRMTEPIEYRITAGEIVSPLYRVEIRRPLRIDQLKVDLAPPAYTRQPTNTSSDKNLSVLQGTVGKFFVNFDKPVSSASIVFTSTTRRQDDEKFNEPEVLPLTSEEGSQVESQNQNVTAKSYSAQVTFNEDCYYSIVADASDGTKLTENKYRVRVREDQPPQVSFESPDDAIEVHSLAELPMRVNVRDDFGLTKAGVVFQINNEREIPLVARDFETVADAANEVAASGKVSPMTQAALEKVLPLEVFELTQKDSVMYFAFAEDNRPASPQRAETEMRFIDIRPFKRTYRVVDPDPAAGMGGANLKTLEELIHRQRYALNRAMQIEKRAATGRKPDATMLEQLMTFETELAASVRETAQGLIARGFDDVELFFQAESAMLASVDSLSVGKWENATLQMRDALKALVEARNSIQLAILKNPDAAQLAALRQFDRQQAQKLRRPKTDKEEARELIRRLEELVAQEASVVKDLERDEVQVSDDQASPQNSEQQSDKSEDIKSNK